MKITVTYHETAQIVYLLNDYTEQINHDFVQLFTMGAVWPKQHLFAVAYWLYNNLTHIAMVSNNVKCCLDLLT